MIEYKHRDLKQAIFSLTCLAYISNDKTLVDNLKADCEQELRLYDDLKQQYSKVFEIIEIIKKAFNSSSIYTNKLKDTYECGWITETEFNLIKEWLEK